MEEDTTLVGGWEKKNTKTSRHGGGIEETLKDIEGKSKKIRILHCAKLPRHQPLTVASMVSLARMMTFPMP
jgi:hypothetical protein